MAPYCSPWSILLQFKHWSDMTRGPAASLDNQRVACALTVINQTSRPRNGIKTYDLAVVMPVHRGIVCVYTCNTGGLDTNLTGYLVSIACLQFCASCVHYKPEPKTLVLKHVMCIRDVRPWPWPWPWHLRPWPCHLLALNAKAKACRVTVPKDKSRLPPGRHTTRGTEGVDILQYLKRAYKHKWGSKLLCDD